MPKRMFFVLFLCSAAMGKDDRLLLWPDGAPDALGKSEADTPTLTVVLPESEKAVGTALIICPGGGYGGVAVDHEGTPTAEWFTARGLATFVLRYRHAPKYHHPAPLQDAQRAMRTVRSRAKEWGVAPNRIGIMGFSAGGHLASSTGTHFDDGRSDSPDPIERVSSRPDFMVLCYPVITFTELYTHQGSKRNLLGKEPDAQLVESFSNEKQVTRKTPPTFIFHTIEDTGVPFENGLAFGLALRNVKVPVEMHFFERGRHGVGMAKDDIALQTWPDLCARWMQVHGWMKR